MEEKMIQHEKRRLVERAVSFYIQDLERQVKDWERFGVRDSLAKRDLELLKEFEEEGLWCETIF